MTSKNSQAEAPHRPLSQEHKEMAFEIPLHCTHGETEAGREQEPPEAQPETLGSSTITVTFSTSDLPVPNPDLALKLVRPLTRPQGR